MNVPRDYLLANQCEKGLRVLIHTPLVKSFYGRVSDEPDTKRRKWVLLFLQGAYSRRLLKTRGSHKAK